MHPLIPALALFQGFYPTTTPQDTAAKWVSNGAWSARVTKTEWVLRQWQVDIEVRNDTGRTASAGLYGLDGARLLTKGGDELPHLGWYQRQMEGILGPDLPAGGIAKTTVAYADFRKLQPHTLKLKFLPPDSYRTFKGVRYEVKDPSLDISVTPIGEPALTSAR